LTHGSAADSFNYSDDEVVELYCKFASVAGESRFIGCSLKEQGWWCSERFSLNKNFTQRVELSLSPAAPRIAFLNEMRSAHWYQESVRNSLQLNRAQALAVYHFLEVLDVGRQSAAKDGTAARKSKRFQARFQMHG
jgi:hypothetical protein